MIQTLKQPEMKTFNFIQNLLLIVLIGIVLFIPHATAQETGKSVSFDGQDDFIYLGDASNFGTPSNFSGDFTFEAWVKNEGTGLWGMVFDFGDSVSDYIFFTPETSTGECRFEYRIQGGVPNFIDGGVFPSGWTHLACRLSAAGEASILINGVVVASASGWPAIDAINGANANYLGESNWPQYPTFKGKMKEVRVWKEHRSVAQINEWMDCEVSGTEPSLTAYYKLSDGIVGANNTAVGHLTSNFGVLTNRDANLYNFALTGTTSNWVGDSPWVEDSAENNSVEFHRYGDNFVLNNEANFDFDSEYTVEYWLFPNVNDGNLQLPFIKGTAGVKVSYYSDFIYDNLIFGQRNEAGYQYWITATGLEYDKWSHVAFTAKEENGGLTSKIYINGVLKTSHFEPNFQIPQTDENVVLGTSLWGRMANIRFWNRSLEQDQISKNMSTIYPVGTTNLVSQYVNYDNYGLGLLDNIGNNHGVRTFSPVFTSDPCFVQFTQEPQDIVLPNFSAPINLTADIRYCNDANFSYQWKFEGNDIPGETNLTLNIPSPTAEDLGKYTLEVMACGKAFTTREAIVSVQNQGKVLHFDGVDDHLTFTNLVGTTPYTIEVRVRFDAPPSNQNIIVKTNETCEFLYAQLAVSKDGYFQHNAYQPGNFEIFSVSHPTKIIANKWYNVSVHYEGSQHWITVDGVAAPSIPRTGLPGVSPIWKVGGKINSFQNFSGEMDELRIWSINTNTINTQATISSPSGDLKHYYQFNEGIAGADNTDPAINTITDPFTFETATLSNFELNGASSNWMGCDNYDTPIVITMPSNKSVFTGNDLELSPFISDVDGSESYQWYRNGLPIAGATSKDLQLANVGYNEEGQYVLEVGRFNACNTFSNEISVNVRGTGEVLNFDGEDDYIFIPASDYQSAYTLECWVKFEDDVTEQSIIVGSNEQGPQIFYSHQLYTDENGYFIHRAVDQNITGTAVTVRLMQSLSPVNPNQWYHVVIRGNGAGAQLLVDGVVQDSEPNTNGGYWPGLTNWQIGNSAVADRLGGGLFLASHFNGEIDELRIWNTWVSDAIINAEKDHEIQNTGLVGMTHYFKFNRGHANGNNANLNTDILPNYKNLLNPVPFPDNARLLNFEMNGDLSNFSDCSPITNPELYYYANSPGSHIGQTVDINLDISAGDTSELNFQWMLDGVHLPDQTSPLLQIGQLEADDFGVYEVIVSDNCDPQFIDTLLLNSFPATNNCFISRANPTDYPDSTQYAFCGDFEGSSSICQNSTIIGVNQVNSEYCGSDKEYLGLDVVFHIPLATSMVVDLTLSNIVVDADMWLFGDDCDLSNCLASSTNDSGSEFIRAALPAGDYYVIVDQLFVEFDEEEINDSLVLDIKMYEHKCVFSQPIDCGDAVMGNTAGSNFIDDYAGFSGYTGQEMVYELVLTEPQTITAALREVSGDLDIFLLDSICNETNLLISSRQNGLSEESFSYGAQPGTYYLVVDGKSGFEGSFELEVSCQNYFDAAVDESDAYIDLSWSIDKKTCVPQDTGVIVRIITPPSTILYEQEYFTAELTPDVITGDFRHLVGDEHTRLYVLRVSNRLSNETLCNEVKTGSTLPFQQPEIISITQAGAPDTIQLVWRNHSHLSDEFRIYREGDQIANLIDGYNEDSLIVSYVDRHDLNNANSIEEGNTYNYCIETYNSDLNMSYNSVCSNGSTAAINFAASDGGTVDKVALTWNDLSAFSDGIIISRNGIQQEILSANETFYNDLSPIFGVVSEYKLTMLRGGDEKIMVTDNGFVEANGTVSGRVISAEGGYPVQNVTVVLKKDTIISNEVVQIEITNALTDFEGRFEFAEVVYGLSNNFLVEVQKDGSDFNPSSISFELNSAQPIKEDLEFVDISDIIVNDVSLMDTLFVNVMDSQDLVVIHWDYDFLNNETTHFILKRNGELIFEGNDAGGKVTHFTDFSGVPGITYTYALDIFRYGVNQVDHEFNSISARYPDLTPIFGFEYVLDGQEQFSIGEMVDPKITFDWSNENHPSQNFDGFRIFRNNILIGEVAHFENNSFSFITVPDEEAGYEIRTFKKINGTTYESTPYPIEADSLITALPLWQPAVFEDPFAFPPPSDRAIILDTDPLGTPAEFFQDGVFTGVILERKVQNSDDSTYIFIEELTKQFIAAQAEAQQNPQIWDAFGIPGENYTYKLSTYLELDGQRYYRSVTFDRTCPDIVGPSNFQKQEDVGVVELTWTDNSVEEGLLSQLYINYSGYELTRRNITDGGAAELIATLPASTQDFDDFISNPVYNLFLDTYVNSSFEYQLRAYFDIEGLRYYSAPLSITGGPLAGTVVEPLPSNLTASDDIPGHIKLCWEWTATKPSQFIVYRDSIPLDTLPTSARAYYDYEAPEDPEVLYKVSSLFNGNESQKVLATGRMPANMRFYGRITNQNSGSGVAGVNVRYSNLGNFTQGIQAEEFSGIVMTDAAGNYYFDDIPHTPGYQYQIKVFSNNVDFAESELLYQSFDSEIFTVGTDRAYNFDFTEYSIPDSFDIVSPIAAVTALPEADSMYVELAWSPVHANYDGFQVFRVNQLIAEIKKGDGFSFKDRNGFPGIDYVYTVRAYKSNEGGRTFSEHVAAKTTFPNILPVENLTVTAFAEMNRMLVSWSHPLDNHDSYRLRRNGEFMANIPTGEVLMWYDSTGVPGLEYQYEVTAIKGANISIPTVVTQNFKGVGEAKNLRVEVNNFEQACSGVLTNDNHVSIFWEYLPKAADGFEVYRDGVLIAEIDSTILSFGDLPLVSGDILMTGINAYYDDYAGIPGNIHTYHVLPFVIREGERHTSGIEELFLEEAIEFPSIAEVKNLDVAQNNILGSVEINFQYPSFQVAGFEILRDGIVIDTVLETNIGAYTYQDFLGLPGVQYNYAVRAYDNREGSNFFGGVACSEDVIYPIVPVPQAFVASEGTFENHIEINWEFSIEAFVDSFYLENISLNTLNVFPSGKRKFVEVVNDFEINKYEYRIRASRINQGQIIFSDWSETVEGWSSRQITGNENSMIQDDVLATNNGFCLDIDGDWAVSGAPKGREQISIYRRVNGGWSLFQSIMSPWGAEDIDFGHSVAISNHTIVVGAQKHVNGAIFIYEFDGQQWGDAQLIISPGPGNFGWAVDIDQDDIIVGNPLWNAGGSNHGAVYWGKRGDNDIWQLTQSLTGSGTQIHFGNAVAIENGYSISKLTTPSAIIPLGYVKDGNGDWQYSGEFSANYMTHFPFIQRDNIDLADGVAVFGDFVFNGGVGRLWVVELENNVPTTTHSIVGTYGPNSSFGSNVGVARVPFAH